MSFLNAGIRKSNSGIWESGHGQTILAFIVASEKCALAKMRATGPKIKKAPNQRVRWPYRGIPRVLVQIFKCQVVQMQNAPQLNRKCLLEIAETVLERGSRGDIWGSGKLCGNLITFVTR